MPEQKMTADDSLSPAGALARAAEAFRAEMFRQGGNVGGVGSADSYVDIEEVDDRQAAAAVIAAFLRALPEAVTACKSHVEVAEAVEEAARG